MAKEVDAIQLSQPTPSTGVVVGVDRFLVKVTGLVGAQQRSVVKFEGGQLGLVRELAPDYVWVMNLSSGEISLGDQVTLEQDELTVAAGEGLIGRVLSALGQPIDGGPPVPPGAPARVFADAPSFTDRMLLNEQLTTGVAVVDILVPIVLGQRIAILGDSQSGRSTFLNQMIMAQKGSGRLIVYAAIGKSLSDINTLISRLTKSGLIHQTVIVASHVFDPLPQAFLVPYTACAIAEHFWQAGRDVVVVYDDLSNHAKIHREISLLSGGSPGRESYPGDIFYIHAQLLERAGKLMSNGKTLTVLPVVTATDNDISGFIQTNVMSMTDGQIFFDLDLFRAGIRPAVSFSLSVSRVGNRVKGMEQKQLAGLLLRKLGDHRRAVEFAHFGTELATMTRIDLELGKMLYAAFKQLPDEIYSLEAQRLVFETILKTAGTRQLDIPILKQRAAGLAQGALAEADYQRLSDELLNLTLIETAERKGEGAA